MVVNMKFFGGLLSFVGVLLVGMHLVIPTKYYYGDVFIKKIEHIFWHEGNKYSLFTMDSETKLMTRHDISVLSTSCKIPGNISSGVRLVVDISEGESPWVQLWYCAYGEPNDKVYRHLYAAEIHINNSKFIKGGEWVRQRGKYRDRGQMHKLF